MTPSILSVVYTRYYYHPTSKKGERQTDTRNNLSKVHELYVDHGLNRQTKNETSSDN